MSIDYRPIDGRTIEKEVRSIEIDLRLADDFADQFSVPRDDIIPRRRQ